jgi:hypothetical protein
MSIAGNRFEIKLKTYRPRNAAIGGCFKTFSIIIITALLATSCVSYQSLPPDWAFTASSSDVICPQITGEYSNTGENADKEERHLAMLLFEEWSEGRTLKYENKNLQ